MMRVAVECSSPLLQKSLEIFLKNYLDTTKKADIVIRDVKCIEDPRCFFIGSEQGADLQKPFSKSELILALEKHYRKLFSQKDEKTKGKSFASSSVQELDFAILERRIEQLTKEYKENIIRAVRAFYEK